MPQSLSDFVARCQSSIRDVTDPDACVGALTPVMRDLLAAGPVALEPRHVAPCDAGYARNAIHVAGDDEMSLFALVWLPGQWTPVHDHGTWGVVGIVQGVLEEHAYSVEGCEDSGFRLSRGGVNVLTEGAVCGFVARDDHTHMVGVREGQPACVSLHLYGRNLNSFHVYDLAAGTRRLIGVTHH
jgi:3-mercaptopropionate dioxygenase